MEHEFNENKTKIRARQGHSIKVDVELKEVVPPDILYHGTATRFLYSITKTGINSGTRQYVHLSDNKETAIEVGKRHGIPSVLEIDAKQMHEDGIKAYAANNGVGSTEFVDKKYIIWDIITSYYGLYSLTSFKKELTIMNECYKQIIDNIDKYE